MSPEPNPRKTLSETAMSRDRILWLILAIGAFVRFWHLRGDLPYVLHYDEPTLVDNAVWMIRNATLNPRFFHYPSGLINLLALCYGVVCLAGVAAGRFDGWSGAVGWLSSCTYPQPDGGGVLYHYPTIGVPALYLIGRSISVLAGTATVALIYFLVARVGASRATARAAALFVAISPLAVENSRFITTDMTAAALATAALVAICAVARTVEARGGDAGSSARKAGASTDRTAARPWVTAGALAGLAAGFKYNAGAIALLLPALAAWRWRAERRLSLRPLIMAACAAVAAFLITTPFALLDAPKFVNDLGYEFRHIASVTPAIEQANVSEASSASKVAQVLWHDLGALGILAVVLGIFACLRSRRLDRIAITIWVLVFLLPLLRWKTLYPRYLLPAWPAVLALAALGVEWVVARTERLIPVRALAGILMAGLVVAPGSLRLARLEARWTRPDPRIEMTNWLAANVPVGGRVVTEKGGAFPKPDAYGLQVVDFLGQATPEEYEARDQRYLVATGRERIVTTAGEREALVQGLAAIRSSSDVVWARDRYSILRLRGEPGWEAPYRAAMAGNDLRGARGILERQAATGGASPHLWRALGEVSAGLGDTTAAIRAYGEAARSDSTDVETYLALSGLLMGARRYDEALSHLERALRHAPREILIYHNLAVLRLYRSQERLRGGDRAGARAEWEAAGAAARVAVRAAPGDPQMSGVMDQVERMGRRWGFRN